MVPYYCGYDVIRGYLGDTLQGEMRVIVGHYSAFSTSPNTCFSRRSKKSDNP
jgi:hypothetical protein